MQKLSLIHIFLLNIYKNKYSKSDINQNLSKYAEYKYGDKLSLRGKISIPEKLGKMCIRDSFISQEIY